MRFLRLDFLSLSLYSAAACGLQGAGAHDASQRVLDYEPGRVYDAGLFTPLEDLNVLSETQFTALKHPLFPDHGVRIKKTKFCDGTVDSFTGYIDVGARHLFFYFFESRSDPAKDDVIMWTNGGPGGSSALGLFMEQGPCRVVDSNTTKFHTESWNSNANMFFIDQPVGVGWSYADYGEHVVRAPPFIFAKYTA
ncbi:hypothetical protein NMY22_g19436 [Coprinellus aureogranulatus]|nr:hypothetical protein NMY22_g19436 [Coprinellus aureogranulatus]